MISGEQSQLNSSKVNPNMPDGRVFHAVLAPYRPQRLANQNSNKAARLAALPEQHSMLVLPSRFLTPEPFPTSFKTGTTLPPSADPSFMAGEGSRFFYAFEMNHRDCKSLESRSLPLETVHLGEHVVLFL
jgi:hypothetical protein